MTTQEIIEGNKLIAEFMTGEMYNTFYLPEFGQYFNSYGQIEYTETFSLNELKYHSSWNWLMPVVEKIESLPLINDAGLCVLIEHSYCRVYLDNWGEYTTVSENSTKNDKLSAVYLSVIEFIKWYNQNK